MQKLKNKKLKKFEKREFDILDRFLRILWRKEVEYKINIWYKQIWMRYLMKFQIGLLISLFIFKSLSDFAFKKRVLEKKFERAQKLN